ncbi:MAG TPA: DUF5924 family protein [Polyangiales bacterium]
MSYATEPVARPRWRIWLDHSIPWISLAVSILGVLMMDRSEEKGVYIAIAAAVSWIAFVMVSVLHRPRRESMPPPGRWSLLLRFGSTFANQSLIHYALLFSAPFYLEACAFTPLQCVFLLVFAVAVAIASWDPWCAWVLVHPLLGSLLLAFASFVGWNAALPMIGVPHHVSIWASALVVGLGIPVLNLLNGAARAWRKWSLVAGASVPALLVLGGSAAIPPAPLRVVRAQIGTNVVEREPVGVASHFTGVNELVCFTAIRAPRGLKDGLLHVWTRDGSLLHALPVEVRGGRRAGFRTWSRQRLSGSAAGRYRCDVITTLGQSLGGVSVDVDGAR